MHWVKLVAAGLLVAAVAGCSKKESPPPQTPSMPFAAPQQDLPAQIPPVSGESPTVVPDAVKGRWKAVKLRVDDKKSSSSREYTVNLGEELSIPDSQLVIKVKEFLPDLKIEGNTFTSASAELLNPSVQVQVLEEGKEVFNGWLFQLFPAVHPFQHERFNIVLRDAVSAS